MIVAKFSMDEAKKKASLRLSGHAGYSDIGTDIVCASASILAYTLAQMLKGNEARGQCKYPPVIKLNEGDANISVRAKDDNAYSDMLHTFMVVQTGYALLAHNYPQYVAVELLGTPEGD